MTELIMDRGTGIDVHVSIYMYMQLLYIVHGLHNLLKCVCKYSRLAMYTVYQTDPLNKT